MRDLVALITSWLLLSAKLSAVSLTAGEWFIDTDPGEGLGTSISGVSGATSSQDVTITPGTIEALEDGPHLLGVRFQDDENNWGQISWRLFLVTHPGGDLITGEDFFNSDPGEGAALPLGDINGTSVTVTPTEAIATLPPGANLIGTRFQNSSGDWGHVSWRLFLVTQPGGGLIAGEYFFNTDPGEGAATALEGVNGTTIIQVPEVALTGLPAGANLIGIRFQNSEGAWGQTSFRIFLNPEPEAQELARIEFSLFEGETELTSGSLLGDGSLVIDLTLVELEVPLNEGDNLVLQLQAIDTQGKAGHKFAKEISIKNFTQDFLDLFFTPTEQTNPSLSGPLADADLDGITNLLEQASGLNPRVANKQSDAVKIGAAASASKTFRFRAASETIFNAPDSTFSLGSLRFEIEVSEDAESWSKASSPTDFTMAPESSANEDGSFSHVLNLTDGGQAKRFHRLRVIQE